MHVISSSHLLQLFCLCAPPAVLHCSELSLGLVLNFLQSCKGPFRVLFEEVVIDLLFSLEQLSNLLVMFLKINLLISYWDTRGPLQRYCMQTISYMTRVLRYLHILSSVNSVVASFRCRRHFCAIATELSRIIVACTVI